MGSRHNRENFYIVGEGVRDFADDQRTPRVRPAQMLEETRKFRFSRMYPYPPAEPIDERILLILAASMTKMMNEHDSAVPSGYTYLGQFITHDLTFDATKYVGLGQPIAIEDLVQGRSPALDLDSVYGRGPAWDPQFYTDGFHLKIGRTAGSNFPPGDPVAGQDLDGFDLPRAGSGPTQSARRQALIPDSRNDENLIVAQTHVAFIRLHNYVMDQIGTRSAADFERARAEVIKHYQRVVLDDYLPRFVDAGVLKDVSDNGRRFFETASISDESPTANSHVPTQGGDPYGTIPIEFAVAAFRFGHSLVRRSYQWNRVFNSRGPGGEATLTRLFNASGMSGTLSPGADTLGPNGGDFTRLPTHWIVDWRRMFDFGARLGAASADTPLPNFARPIDTLLSDPLALLPLGAIGGDPNIPFEHRSLPFRSLMRGRMVRLPSGQQMADFFGVGALTRSEILSGKGGAVPSGLSQAEQDTLATNTPLWFYILREAEVRGGGKLGQVGSRIVVETIHRSIEVSRTSVLRDRGWKPSLVKTESVAMADLLCLAYGRDLVPLG
jgi:hypothetical protein